MDDISQRIGAKIKSARRAKKFSREQVARRMEVSQQTIEKYEKGSIDISVKRLIKISNILGICITSFLEDDIDRTLINHFSKKLFIDIDQG